MVIRDRIRLTGLLRKKPWKRGFFYGPDSPATRQAHPETGLTAVSVEPLGAVARRSPVGCAGYEPPRTANRNTGDAPGADLRRDRPREGVNGRRRLTTGDAECRMATGIAAT